MALQIVQNSAMLAMICLTTGAASLSALAVEPSLST